MTDQTAAFIPELLRAANEVPKLAVPERAMLLKRAAATIRDLRDEINYSETPANDTGNLEDIVYYLSEAANLVDQFSDSEVVDTILEAIGIIHAAQILLEEKQKIERSE